MRSLHNLLATPMLLAIIILLLLLGGGGSTALGESRGGQKVIKLEAIKVEGRIQKPQAFYVLQRSSLNFEGLELKQSFIPKIVKSIEKQPF